MKTFLNAILITQTLVLAQTVTAAPPSGIPQAADIEEVQPIPDDDDFLPSDSAIIESNREHVKNVEDSVTEVLEPTDAEIRRNKNFGIGIMRGTASPWVGVGIDSHIYVNTGLAVGIIAGRGEFEDQGEVSERTYNISYNSKSLAVSAKKFFVNYQPINLELTVGYAIWEGLVVPKGSDELSSDNEKLTSSFEANGWFSSISLGCSWFWESGIFVHWVPIGIQLTGIRQTDTSRDSDTVLAAVNETIEPPAFFGISNLRIGMAF